MNTPTGPDPQINCEWCGARVPYEFTPEGLGLEPGSTNGVAWCTGICARKSFQAQIVEIARHALTPEQYVQLTANVELPPIAPAAMPELTSPANIRLAVQLVTSAVLQQRISNRDAKALLFALQTAAATLRIKDTAPPRTDPSAWLQHRCMRGQVYAALNPQLDPNFEALVGLITDYAKDTPCSTATPVNANSTTEATRTTGRSSAASATTASPARPRSPSHRRAANTTTHPTDPSPAKDCPQVSRSTRAGDK
jgi:hypothetical protein